jgi:branched-chain amino acid transport system ATP-binding protein
MQCLNAGDLHHCLWPCVLIAPGLDDAGGDAKALGLAPVVVEDLVQRVSNIKRELGITILLVEQNASVALAVADHGYLLENGRVVLEGPAAELRGRREIQQSYLGQATGEERRSYRALRNRPSERPND